MKNREVALEFLRHNCAGDIDGLALLLVRDRTLTGALYSCGSAVGSIGSMVHSGMSTGRYNPVSQRTKCGSRSMRIAVSLSMCVLVVACSGSGSSISGGAVDPAVSGLDERPSNTTCLAPTRSITGVTYGLTDAFPNTTFSDPLLVVQAPGDSGYLMVVEQGGAIYRVNTSGTPVKSLFADLVNLVDSGANEAGLLGLAFHPDYASNRQVFVSYTTSDDPVGDTTANLRSRLSRFIALPDGSAIDTGAVRRDVLEEAQPFTNHNGGYITFHPTEGYLYVGLGDGGSAGDPQDNAQNTNSRLGKMLRIDVNVTDIEWNAGTRYKIPNTNPYASGGGAPEVYALGLRNPWRWSFDRQNGELWAGDVGQGSYEEIDRIVLGGNFGWRHREGAHCYNPSTGCQTAGLTDPVVEYTHSGGRCSVTGGYVYRGAAIAALQGRYVYGDYCTGEVWSIPTGTPNPTPQLLFDSPHLISSFGEDTAGEMYVVRHGGSGRVFRLTADGGTPSGPTAPAQLTQTGCVAVGNPTQPASGLISYEINAPFWSDGVLKERYLSVPDGTTIGRTTEGRFEFPPGSVLTKNFRQNGSLIETRLLMRHPDGGWEGYSYEWNASQTEATLVTTTTTKPVNGQTWTFFASNDCLRCHTESAVFVLGPEVMQMNRSHTYPQTGRTRNQLATLEAVGLFSAPLPAPPANLPALPSPTDPSHSLTERARAYLHANCSNCHRPNGGTPTDLDLRYTTTLAASGMCGVPTQGDLGVTGAHIITPLSPSTSVLYLRMNTRGANQMPPFASALVDSDGAALISSWIGSLASCP